MAKDDLKNDNPIKESEEEALIESNADTEEETELGVDETDENQLEASEVKKVVGDEASIPAEVAAINTDNETAKEAEKIVMSADKKSRSKRYLAIAEKVDPNKRYSVDEAIELTKNTSTTKFEGSVELHVKLTEKKGKKKGVDELVRGMFSLPHGVGKDLKVVVVTEEMIDEVFKTKKVNFDVAVATPSLMPKLGKIAKILGPKGKMPNPKFGTVSENPEKAKEEIEKGRVEYKADAGNVVHQMVGKTSWDNQKIKENIMAVVQIFPKNRIQSLALTSTMGTGIKVEL